ncbi:hypothetical protein FRC09_006082 [Ceratobasidium sp. 395]|nr:hypothetical protein FRC09_006082 [Ceratobasidium sp. 395]
MVNWETYATAVTTIGLADFSYRLTTGLADRYYGARSPELVHAQIADILQEGKNILEMNKELLEERKFKTLDIVYANHSLSLAETKQSFIKIKFQKVPLLSRIIPGQNPVSEHYDAAMGLLVQVQILHRDIISASRAARDNNEGDEVFPDAVATPRQDTFQSGHTLQSPPDHVAIDISLDGRSQRRDGPASQGLIPEGDEQVGTNQPRDPKAQVSVNEVFTAIDK